MRAVVLNEQNELVFHPDHPEPEGAEIVEIGACGVCHTDLHVVDGDYPVTRPKILGHEITGTHAELGSVMVYAPWGCGSCRECSAGLENICADATEAGLVVDGGYAERIAVPDRRYLVPIDGLDPVAVAPLACGGLTAYRAVSHVLDGLRARPDARVAVIGVGGLGQYALRYLSLLTDAEVGAVDLSPEKQAAALVMGAAMAGDDLGEMGRFDAIVDFVGAGPTLGAAAQAVQKGGQVVAVGVGGGAVPVGFGQVPHEARFQTSVWGSLAELQDLIDLARREPSVVGSVEMLPLEEAPVAHQRLRAGEVESRLVLTV